MTLKSIIATTLQLLGVFFACNVLASGMGFVSFSGGGSGEMSADWAEIWTFNLVFWSVGLCLSLVLIFVAAPLASFLCKLAGSKPDAEISRGSISSEVFVQVFAGFLLVRETYGALNQMSWIFRSFDVMQVIVLLGYYGVTIGASIWLIRNPWGLAKFRSNKSRETKAEPQR